jgi:hypothetical protein
MSSVDDITRAEFEVESGPTALDSPAEQMGPKPLPGSVFLAERIERRKFLRRSAKTLFFGFMATSTGTAGLLGFLADPAAATGQCCPYSCCGPSACCDTSCCSKPCCSPVGTDNCANNGSTCFGYSNTWSGQSCWSCVLTGNCKTVTCCDCATNNQTGCPNPEGKNRCICYQVFPYCDPTQVRGHLLRVSEN